MAKTHSRFVCQVCGKVSSRAFGRCPGCDSWDSMIEEIVEAETEKSARAVRGLTGTSKVQPLAAIEGRQEERLPLPIEEFARVLGGGIVPGSVVLIGGDPGIGKSTLTLQMAMQIAVSHTVLYVSGEESERQIKMRADRLAEKEQDGRPILPARLLLVTETNLAQILKHIEDTKPMLVIIDSIQTMTLPDMESAAGSISQVRECAARLRELAKSSGVTVFLIGHVTKEGTIAGPRVLEHIVDTVLYLEGEHFQSYRLLRSVKNRFGATSEVGVFEMQEKGMVEVRNPSEVFLAERMINAPGSAIAVTMEGTRPLLVEIQGLTTPTSFGNPRRTANGIDFNRLLILAAVLTRRLGINLSSQDVITNVVSGLRIDEPAADLAVAAAIASSYRDVPVRADTVLIGEVGLSGELRMVGQMQTRLREAAKLGFRRAVVPKRLRKSEPVPNGIEVIEARSLREALKAALLEEETEKPAKGRASGHQKE
ncbi:MAG TPA: DNA repair protein RadA [Anaerolineaceae bacterium]|jgi:DNA repair protein RadA/Sms|nr:DNA repair protein RadA [Anaerolineaceae bacterium]